MAPKLLLDWSEGLVDVSDARLLLGRSEGGEAAEAGEQLLLRPKEAEWTTRDGKERFRAGGVASSAPAGLLLPRRREVNVNARDMRLRRCGALAAAPAAVAAAADGGASRSGGSCGSMVRATWLGC